MNARLALLISSPGINGEPDYLSGTKTDLDNYVIFLKSPLGGAWNESEIVSLTNSSKSDVDAVISRQAMSTIHSLYSAGMDGILGRLGVPSCS